MVCNYVKKINFFVILIIGIYPTNEAPSPLEIRTRMSISGSLNRLCQNDPNSSDELPSCECLEQFSVQGQFLQGNELGDRENPLTPKLDDPDLLERTYKNVDPIVAVVGGNKLAGLKCMKEDGSETELEPIYSYTVHLSYTVTSDFLNGLLITSKDPNGDKKGSKGVLYVDNMNDENAATIESAQVLINNTVQFEMKGLGKICENTNKPKTFESFIWNVVNLISTNSSTTCNIPKDTFFPITSEKIITTITVNKPLKCGTYTVYTDASVSNVWALGIQLSWNFVYSRYCQYFEE